jgi:hypothetical protein
VGDVAVAAVAVFFAGMGALALARPGQIVERFGISLGGRDGRNEVRAVYGGFGIAVAAVLVVAIGADGGFRDGVLVAIAAALAGMAAGRLVSLVLERTDRSSPTPFWLVVELVLAGLLLLGIGG